jgi:hypothetical protein
LKVKLPKLEPPRGGGRQAIQSKTLGELGALAVQNQNISMDSPDYF